MIAPLLTAVGRAQHEQAQALLIELAECGVQDLQLAALDAMTQLTAPNAQVRAAAWCHARSSEAPLAARGLLTFGTMSGRGTTADVARARHLLLAEETTARRNGHLALWIKAVGNNRTAAVVPTLRRYATSENPQLRSEALAGLVRIPGPSARDAALEAFQTEAAPSIRQRVAFALATRADVDAYFSVSLTRPSNPRDLRRAGARALAQRKGPRAKAALRRLVRDPDYAIRTIAKNHRSRPAAPR